MSLVHEPKEIDAILLCGGLGKRLRDVVNDRPKVMAEIDGRPFLDVLIDFVASYGFRRFILCMGYMGHKIKQHYQSKTGSVDILFSEEKEPLGTGGAIKNAEPLIKSNPFLVMNGDSFCPLNLDEFINFHLTKRALLSIALANVKQTSDYGAIGLDDSKRILSFDEKGRKKKGLVNAGVYLFDRRVLSLIPDNTPYSLEHDLFPQLANRELYGYITQESFIDIGTPERFEKAKEILLRERA
ncbi:MAG: nucleotidyltransferase family protein [Candidatus Brocadiales bacterium]|nr:nucleotidyltransferase family protein [Candidatus Brocadiales bacterium]